MIEWRNVFLFCAVLLISAASSGLLGILWFLVGITYYNVTEI